MEETKIERETRRYKIIRELQDAYLQAVKDEKDAWANDRDFFFAVLADARTKAREALEAAEHAAWVSRNPKERAKYAEECDHPDICILACQPMPTHLRELANKLGDETAR